MWWVWTQFKVWVPEMRIGSGGNEQRGKCGLVILIGIEQSFVLFIILRGRTWDDECLRCLESQIRSGGLRKGRHGFSCRRNRYRRWVSHWGSRACCPLLSLPRWIRWQRSFWAGLGVGMGLAAIYRRTRCRRVCLFQFWRWANWNWPKNQQSFRLCRANRECGWKREVQDRSWSKD